MSKHALLTLAQGHEEIEALTQVDLLRRAGIQVTVAGLGGTEITGAHGIAVKADISLDQFSDTFDAVILPGGMPGTAYLMESETVLQIVRDAYAKQLLCAAICAAPQVLNAAGILEGKNFTCYPGVEEKIRNGTFVPDQVVQDGNVITSRGVGTAIPFALKIVEYLLDQHEAASLADTIVYTGS